MHTFRNTSGFTLVEMVLATTIFAIMSIIILSIYLQTTALSARLKATRYLSETSREITETIADDIKTHGISAVNTTIPSSSHIYWNGSSEYTTSGSEILSIGDGTRMFIYGQKTALGIDPCDTIAQQDMTIHCGLYLIKNSDYTSAFNLVDSFVPEEAKKRVKVSHLRFYISGNASTTEKKVTIIFRLTLMPRIGVPNMNASESNLDIETTISERIFQSQ